MKKSTLKLLSMGWDSAKNYIGTTACHREHHMPLSAFVPGNKGYTFEPIAPRAIRTDETYLELRANCDPLQCPGIGTMVGGGVCHYHSTWVIPFKDGRSTCNTQPTMSSRSRFGEILIWHEQLAKCNNNIQYETAFFAKLLYSFYISLRFSPQSLTARIFHCNRAKWRQSKYF